MIGPGKPEPAEELVAYLDGELSEEEVLQVERRLAADPAYREQLQGLRRTWSLLDDLPRSAGSAEFASSTVTMVAQTIRQPRRKRASGWRPWAFGGAAVLAVGCLSFWMVSRRLDAPQQQFLRDLPVIQNVDLYRHVEDVDFLRRLIEDGVFVEEEVDA